MTDTRPAFAVRTAVKVTGVHEHIKTIRGRRDSGGNPFTESMSLGWFLHVDFDGDGTGEISFGVGPDRPPVDTGDMLEITIVRLQPPHAVADAKTAPSPPVLTAAAGA